VSGDKIMGILFLMQGGREFWIHLAAQLRCFYGFLGFLGGEKEKTEQDNFSPPKKPKKL